MCLFLCGFLSLSVSLCLPLASAPPLLIMQLEQSAVTCRSHPNHQLYQLIAELSIFGRELLMVF